jgi:lipopolysaccharide export system permease protein
VGDEVTLLDRYLIRQILWYTLLVVGVLLTLSALFLFLEQQDDVGVGTYTMTDALFVTFLNLPKQFFQLLPIAALLGALVGLGNLARGSELIVVRASGVSVARIAGSAALAGVLLLTVGGLVGEFLAPPLESYARQVKTFGKFAKFSFAGSGGAWVKDGNRIVSIQQQTADDTFGGVYVYVIGARPEDGVRRLDVVGRADSAVLVGRNTWRLDNYAESALAAEGVKARRVKQLDVESTINPEFLGIAVVEPSGLTIRGLVRYLRHLRGNGLDTRTYESALWSRIARSLSTVLLCMLAVPFVLGPLRSSNAGSRTVIGILIGVVYFLVTRTLENSGEVYGLPPLLSAWAPAAALALVTTAAIARVR